ncbi:MAG TPA: hypothetical protein VH082_03555 [Rudaea sp.]|jgi:hypothetical protein|nr:hypothetical protein [Rudaea sp.]
MAHANGSDKVLSDDPATFARDVQRGASRVLDAAGKGAKRASREIKPGVGKSVKDALRSGDPETALAGLIRDYPWTSLAVVAIGSALLARTLFRLR